VRRHAKDQLDKLQKDGDVGEDEVRRAEKSLDEMTHKHVEHVDEVLKHKEAELLEV
jgi:ribosome recycling factor